MSFFTKNEKLPINNFLTILLFMFFAAIPQNSMAQNEKITLSGNDITLRSAFEQIEKQSGLTIAYSESRVDVNRTVTINVTNGSMDEVMGLLLKNTGFTYQRTQNHIVIVKQSSESSDAGNAPPSSDAGAAAPSQPAGTQNNTAQSTPRNYSGKVVLASDNSPVIGATVVVDGTSIGTSSSVDGGFELRNVPGSAKTVTVTYLGMEAQTKPLGKNMIFSLETGAERIEEVVVTGFGKVDRRIFTGAADRLSADDVKMDGMADLSRALEGRSAGVTVQNVSGTFGTAPKIRVRGATSIYGSSKPLWVVDGIIIEDAVEVSADQLSSGDAITLISSAVAGLNPDDIDTYQILKDGSATSIYGARAMAGVIVITTKRGQAGTSSINYTGEFTMRLVPRYSEFDIMNSQEQMSVYQDMRKKGWLRFAETLNASNSGVFGRMYQLTNYFNPETGKYGLENSDAARAAYLREAEMRNTDWFKVLFRPSVVQNHAVSISGGTDKTRYYASMSVMNDPGWTRESSVERYTMNLNASYNILKNLSFTMIGSGSHRKQEAPGTLNQLSDAYYGEVSRSFDINPYSYALNSSRTLDSHTFYTRNYAPFNILHELEHNNIDLAVTDVKFQGEIKWGIIPGLDVTALGAFKQSTTVQEHSIHEFSNMAMAYRAGIEPENATIAERNAWLYTNPDIPNTLPQTVLPEGGFLDKKEYKMRGYDFRTIVDFNKTYRSTHIINALGGMEISSMDRTAYTSRGVGYQFDQGGVPFYDYMYFKQGIEKSTQYYSDQTTYIRTAAFFANATYSWKHRYSLNGTIRYEGTNRLGRSRTARWLPTWNVAGAWNVHEEPFFAKALEVMSHFNIKASYSLTADRGPAFVTNSRMIILNETKWRPSADLQESALYISEFENKNLTYEKKHELNVGVNMGFLNHRINIAADFYTRRMKDLIGPTYTASGKIEKWGNVAEMKSKGVELTISTRNIETKDIKWNTDFTFAWTDNEITKLHSTGAVMQLVAGSGYALQGYPHYSVFSFQNAGLTENGLPLIINEKGVATTKDISFSEMQKHGHLIYEGPSEPIIAGGFGNVLTYKNFKLNIFMTYAFGSVVRLTPSFKYRYDDLTAMSKSFKNRWALPGDENYTSVPAVADTRTGVDYDLARGYNAYNYSHDRIAKGDFIRMKEISLTYDFPSKWIEQIKLKKLQLKFQASNPFLIYSDSKLNGQDPEFVNSGGVATPMPKQFTFTLRFGF